MKVYIANYALRAYVDAMNDDRDNHWLSDEALPVVATIAFTKDGLWLNKLKDEILAEVVAGHEDNDDPDNKVPEFKWFQVIASHISGSEANFYLGKDEDDALSDPEAILSVFERETEE